MSAAMDPAAATALRLGLALLFGAAALHKWADRREFAAAVAAYRLAPASWAGGLADGILAVEVALAVALPFDPSGWASCVAAALLLLYAGAIAVNLARGRREIACGCGGPAGEQALDETLVVRNLALAAMAAVAAWPVAARPWSWLDAVTVAGAVASGSLLYLAAETARANRARLARHGRA